MNNLDMYNESEEESESGGLNVDSLINSAVARKRKSVRAVKMYRQANKRKLAELVEPTELIEPTEPTNQIQINLNHRIPGLISDNLIMTSEKIESEIDNIFDGRSILFFIRLYVPKHYY